MQLILCFAPQTMCFMTLNPLDVHLLGLLHVSLLGAPVPVLLVPLLPGLVSPIMPPVLVMVTTIRHDQIWYLKQINVSR